MKKLVSGLEDFDRPRGSRRPMKKQLFTLLAGAALLSAGCTEQPSPTASPSAASPAPVASSAGASAPASPSTAPASPSAVPSAAPSTSASGQAAWIAFQAPDGSFSVEAPVTLAPRPDPNAPTAVLFEGQGGPGQRTWEVGHQPIPPVLSSQKKPDEIAMMVLSAQTFTNRPEAKQVTVGGHPGFVTEVKRDDGTLIDVAVTIVDGEAYAIRVITPKGGKVDKKPVARFFESLEILKGAPAASSSGDAKAGEPAH